MNSRQTLQAAKREHFAGRLVAAEAAYRLFLRRTSRVAEPAQYADALHFLGLLRFEARHAADAIRLLQEALSITPGNPLVWNNLGNVLVGAGREEDARAAYERATLLAPGLVEAWHNLGAIHERGGRRDMAIAAFIRADPR